MAESLDITLEVQLPDGGTQVTQANDHGLPLQRTHPRTPCARKSRNLPSQLFDLNKAAETGKA